MGRRRQLTSWYPSSRSRSRGARPRCRRSRSGQRGYLRAFLVATAFFAAARRFRVAAVFLPAAFRLRMTAAFLPAALALRVTQPFFAISLLPMLYLLLENAGKYDAAIRLAPGTQTTSCSVRPQQARRVRPVIGRSTRSMLSSGDDLPLTRSTVRRVLRQTGTAALPLPRSLGAQGCPSREACEVPSGAFDGSVAWLRSGRNSWRRSPSVSNCSRTIPFVSPASAREVRSVEPE